MRVRLRVKLLFWLLLGACSVILAEVVSFSSPFPFFDAWGLGVVLPLYSLHVLVLAWIVFRPKRVTLSALFLAGALLGLYEAYITKVLWQPTWGDSTWTAGGMYVVQSAILLLFWHPLMAFMLPLFAAEGLFTSSGETLASLPLGLRRRLGGRKTPVTVIIFAIFCGLYQAVGSPSPGVSLLSGLAAGLVFGGLSLVWRRVTRGQAYPLRAMLPSRREALVLGALLLAVYLWQGITLRPEALPRSLGPHLTVWALYLLFGLLLALNLRRAPALPQAEEGETPPSDSEPAAAGSQHFISWKLLAIFWAVFPLASAAGTLLKPAAAVVALLTWGIGLALGALLLLRSLLAPGRA